MTYVVVDEGADDGWCQNAGDRRHGIAKVHQFIYTHKGKGKIVPTLVNSISCVRLYYRFEDRLV